MPKLSLTVSTSAYVTHEDISGIPVFQGQTVLVVKAPEETKLEVPTPTEVGITINIVSIRVETSNAPQTWAVIFRSQI